jgi:hypothetical protein
MLRSQYLNYFLIKLRQEFFTLFTRGAISKLKNQIFLLIFKLITILLLYKNLSKSINYMNHRSLLSFGKYFAH